MVPEVLPRVRAELATEPVEDLRVDTEDGYLGTRVTSLEEPTRRRGVRSLDPTCCPSATGRRCTPPGRCTPGWSAGPWSAASVVLRGLDCGAVDTDEVQAATGLARADLDRLTGRRPGP